MVFTNAKEMLRKPSEIGPFPGKAGGFPPRPENLGSGMLVQKIFDLVLTKELAYANLWVVRDERTKSPLLTPPCFLPHTSGFWKSLWPPDTQRDRHHPLGAPAAGTRPGIFYVRGGRDVHRRYVDGGRRAWYSDNDFGNEARPKSGTPPDQEGAAKCRNNGCGAFC